MTKSIRVSTKKRGRPKTTGKGTLIGVRLLSEPLTQLDAWSAGQDDKPSRPEAIRRLIELGLRVPANKIPLITATGDAAAAAGHAASSASEMAGHQIDKLGDALATTEERKARKRRLLKGPSEFRDIRIDHPAAEPARASKKPAPGKKTRPRRS